MKIRFTPSAKKQFLEGLAYIRRDKPEAAKHFKAKSEKALKRLLKFPNAGRLIPEYPGMPFRELLVPPYRFFYKHVEHVVWIVAVWHSAQVPENPDPKSPSI